MSVASGDINTYHSGGSGNSDPNASLGGAKSTTQWAGAVKNDLFDNVSSAESASGDTEYRAIYVQNDNGTDTLLDARVFISSNTTSSDDTLAIAMADEAINATIETIANEGTAPVGPSFSSPTDYSGGLKIGDLTAGQYRGLWVRRVVSAAAGPITDNTATLKIQGDTA